MRAAPAGATPHSTSAQRPHRGPSTAGSRWQPLDPRCELQNLLTGKACSRRHSRTAADGGEPAASAAVAAERGSAWDCSSTRNLTGSILFLGDSTDCLVVDRGCAALYPEATPVVEPGCHGEWGALHMCRGSQQPGAQLKVAW